METIDSKIINDWLSTVGPKAHGTGTPLFRLAWSEDLFEVRHGQFLRVYTITMPDGSKREFRSIEEATERVKKYSYIKDRWILEQWAPPELCNLEELPEAKNGSYEALFVFEDSKFNPLPLNKRVVEILVSRALAPSRTMAQRVSADKEEEQRREEEEQKYLEEALDLSPTQSLLHHGEAIIVPDIQIAPPNLRSKE